MAKVDVVSTGFDWLKLWAVIGPLLTAAASAIWSRHIQRQDRTDADRQEAARRDWESTERANAHKREIARAHRLDLRDATTGFYAAVSDYPETASFWLSEEEEHWKDNTQKAKSKLTTHFAMVMMLGDRELQKRAIALWNVVLDMPRRFDNPPDAEYLETIERFKDAKADYVLAASAAIERERML